MDEIKKRKKDDIESEKETRIEQEQPGCSRNLNISKNEDDKNKEEIQLPPQDFCIDEKDLVNTISAEEYLLHKDINLLEYEKQMFLDVVNNDSLVICAKGLLYDRVLLNILKVYCDAGNLILIIHSSDWEEQYFKSKLESKNIHEIANTAIERERTYLEGGVQFISTRILVVDLLKGRIPIELITGVIVLRAHSIVESCQEAFALRLYRQRNKTGFIKAFSSSPEAFTIGYGHVERTMRNLFVKQLFIWPRFHAIVQASLKPYESQVIELHVPMTIKMKLLQIQILDVMNFLVREVKRINRSIELEEITVENCVTKKFHKILQAQLDCIWHQLNSQTKLIVADLKILRNIMITVMYNDAVSTYALIKRYRTTDYALSNSGWTLLDAAEQIFKLSKERVYNADGEFEPEPCPKWDFLANILKVEIPADMKKFRQQYDEPPKVLILCQDSRTCYQLRQYLTQSGERYLIFAAMQQQMPIGKMSKSFTDKIQCPNDLVQNFNQKQTKINTKCTETTKTTVFDSSNIGREKMEDDTIATNDGLSKILCDDDDDLLNKQDFQESYMLTLTQSQFNESDLIDRREDMDVTQIASQSDKFTFESFPELDNLDMSAIITDLKQPLICIQTFKTEREGSMALDRVLEEIKPHYVIMYHCNVTAIRQLEIYEARQRRAAKDRTKVFFLIHSRTVEEQSYLTSLRREKQAFELIIQTKSTMVVPEYQDGKSEDAFILHSGFKFQDEDKDNATTRKAGGQVVDSKAVNIQKVVVDMREFRSDLPCLLHKRGIEVQPVTITVGDYILTPEICIERKSISDLIGSLNSGRLYNQCTQMIRFYAKPVLLIEFDQNKPFHLQGRYMVSQNSNTAHADIVKKLIILVLTFSKLRLIWSPSPYATAQLFEELKQCKEEPDAKQASALGADEVAGAFDSSKFNSNIYDFLLRIPGVNTKNISKLMRHGGNLSNLLKKSQVEINELLESQENGKLFYEALHVSYLPDKDELATNVLVGGKQIGRHSRFRRGAAANRGLTRK